jgi:hypothetical protein
MPLQADIDRKTLFSLRNFFQGFEFNYFRNPFQRFSAIVKIAFAEGLSG